MPWNTPREWPVSTFFTVWREAQDGASWRDDGGEIGVLAAAEQLRGVQVRGARWPAQPGMDLVPRQAGAERQREGVVDAARGDVGKDGVQVKRARDLVLQPDMGERRALGDADLGDRIVQIGALAAGDLDQGEARARSQCER